jgi:hypothetical protein
VDVSLIKLSTSSEVTYAHVLMLEAKKAADRK